MSHQPIPKFASEEEEAAWWDAHPEVLAERFLTARQQGQVRRLSQTNLPGAAETVTIRIPQQELKRARTLAAKRGLRYQTYLKMLLHEALDAEERKARQLTATSFSLGRFQEPSVLPSDHPRPSIHPGAAADVSDPSRAK